MVILSFGRVMPGTGAFAARQAGRRGCKPRDDRASPARPALGARQHAPIQVPLAALAYSVSQAANG